MKKTLLILAVSIFIFQFPNSQAQSYKTVGDNTWFLSLGGGGVLYKHSGEGQFSVPTATVNLGCWITRPLAFRFGFDMMMTPSHYQNGGTETSMYFMGSAEFLWDVNATFFNVYNGTLQKPIPV